LDFAYFMLSFNERARSNVKVVDYVIDEKRLLRNCPAPEHLWHAIFGTTTSIFDLWSRPWDVARLLGLRGVPSCPHPSEEVG